MKDREFNIEFIQNKLNENNFFYKYEFLKLYFLIWATDKPQDIKNIKKKVGYKFARSLLPSNTHILTVEKFAEDFIGCFDDEDVGSAMVFAVKTVLKHKSISKRISYVEALNEFVSELYKFEKDLNKDYSSKEIEVCINNFSELNEISAKEVGEYYTKNSQELSKRVSGFLTSHPKLQEISVWAKRQDEKRMKHAGLYSDDPKEFFSALIKTGQLWDTLRASFSLETLITWVKAPANPFTLFQLVLLGCAVFLASSRAENLLVGQDIINLGTYWFLFIASTIGFFVLTPMSISRVKKYFDDIDEKQDVDIYRQDSEYIRQKLETLLDWFDICIEESNITSEDLIQPLKVYVAPKLQTNGNPYSNARFTSQKPDVSSIDKKEKIKTRKGTAALDSIKEIKPVASSVEVSFGGGIVQAVITLNEKLVVTNKKLEQDLNWVTGEKKLLFCLAAHTINSEIPRDQHEFKDRLFKFAKAPYKAAAFLGKHGLKDLHFMYPKTGTVKFPRDDITADIVEEDKKFYEEEASYVNA